jgi:tetratricopeptide (TPR) repeat protein
MRVESVAWISERKDMLYSFFLLWAALFYLSYFRNQRKKLYYLCLLSFVLSLLSKPMGMLFPLLMVLFDYFLGKAYLSRKNLIEKAPFFIIAATFILFIVSGGVRKTLHEPPFYLLNNILIASYAIIFYLYKLFVPVRLSCLYPYPQLNGNLLPGIFLLSPAILSILITVVAMSRKYTKKIVFGCLFFLIAILPSLQLIPYLPGIAADRNTYIPSIGLFYIIGNAIVWLYARFKKSAAKNILSLFFIFVVAVLSFLTWQRCKVWKNTETLWRDALDKYPNSAEINNNLAVAYSDQGQPDKAIFYYRKALEIDPYSAESYNNIGVALLNKKEYDKAMPQFIKTLRIDPTFADAYFNIAAIYAMKGDHKKVVAFCHKAIKFNPEHANAYAYLCSAYGNLGNLQEAITYGKEAVRSDPESGLAHINLSVAYYYTKQYDLASRYLESAIKLGVKPNPEFVESLRQQK